jgi:hypothetical protein
VGDAATLGVFGWLKITDINLRFIFLFFAHITFQFVSCFFGFGLCQSRRNICPRLRPSRLGSGRPNGSAYLSNASAVELHALQNLRPFFPSTNSHAPYYHYLCHEIFGSDFFRNSQLLIDIECLVQQSLIFLMPLTKILLPPFRWDLKMAQNLSHLVSFRSQSDHL